MPIAFLWRLKHHTLALMVAGILLASGHDVRAQAAAAPVQEATPITVKLYTEDIVLDATGLATTTIHLEEQATNAAAAQQMGQFPVSFSESMADVDISEAYTLKADGRKLAVATSAIFSQSPPGSSQDPMFNDMRQKTVVFPNLEAGDSIVLTYVIHDKEAYLPGQFFTTNAFSRSFAYDEARGSIVVPKSLILNTEAHEIALNKEDSGSTTTYRWHYSAPNAQPPDTSVLSSFDRSPRLIVSSLKNYDDFAHAYAALVAPKIAVTDPIKALAEQITAGTSDRRQQAEKIYNWVSQHIRYVGIEFGVGGIIPHDSATVLANGYGDCKDHVVLFSALLKAKGIDSEFVLIDYNASYSLPDTPRIGAFDHAITWIPEFKMYADTTAGVAPFGVLAFQLYGKPVLYAVASGPAIHQTPILAPGAASLSYATTAHLDDQGNIVGETKTTATGPFALMLRGLGRIMEAGGPDRVATGLLQREQIPGTAHFTVPPLDMSAADYTISSTYSLGPYSTILTGQPLVPPSQLELLDRPGDTLMGPLTNLTVKDSDPTPCYSGRAVEDVALDAPAGRKFLRIPTDAGFDGAHISYKTHWSLAGQTMTLHREVTTKFDAPLCTAEVRSEAAKAMAAVRDDLHTAVSLAVSATPEQQKLGADILAAQTAIQQGDHAKAVTLLTEILASASLPSSTKWATLTERGIAYADQRQYDKAIADFNASIELDPKQAESYAGRGEAYNGKNDWDKAIADFDKALELKPDMETALTYRAGAYYFKRDFDHVIADCMAAIKLNPNDGGAFAACASGYEAKQDYDHAIAYYGDAIRLKPDNAIAFENRGRIYANIKKDYDRAIADYTDAIRLTPGDADLMHLRGLSYDAKQNYDAAIADYNEAIRLKPDFPEALVDRGAVYVDKKDYDHALTDFNQALKLKPDLALAFYNRAVVYFSEQDYDHAIADNSAAIRLNPNYTTAYNNRGSCYLAISKPDYDLALADFSEAIRQSPDYARAYYNRGRTYAAKRDFDHAITDQNDAIRLNANYAQAYHERGNDYLAKRDYDHAIADYSQTIRFLPNYGPAFAYRANAYAAKQDYDHAIADYSDAIRLNSKDVYALNGRAEAYHAKQDYSHAAADYSESLKLKPDDTNILIKQGVDYYAERDLDHAIADYDAAIKLKPGDGEALDDRGLAYAAKQDYDHALADYGEALRLDPLRAPVFVNRAGTYLRMRDIDHALADINEAIRLKPDDPIAFGTRAAAYIAKQDYDHAIADFSEAIRLKPGNAAVLIGRAGAYNAKQDYPHAIADDGEALKLNPAFGPALNDRCWARAMQNQNLDDALSDCNAALKQAPNNSAILDSRGFVYFRMGKLDLAKADYDAAIAAGPRGATLYKRGIVKNRLGDAEGGKADIAAALTIDPHAGDDMSKIGVTP